MIHGASFSPSPSDSTLWRKIMLDVIQSMLTLAVDKYTGVLAKVDKKPAEPSLKKPKTFEEASVVKQLQQNDT
jgi:hypothetical protein